MRTHQTTHHHKQGGKVSSSNKNNRKGWNQKKMSWDKPETAAKSNKSANFVVLCMKKFLILFRSRNAIHWLPHTRHETDDAHTHENKNRMVWKELYHRVQTEDKTLELRTSQRESPDCGCSQWCAWRRWNSTLHSLEDSTLPQHSHTWRRRRSAHGKKLRVKRNNCP